MTLQVTLFFNLARNSEEFTGGGKSLPPPPLPPYHCAARCRITVRFCFGSVIPVAIREYCNDWTEAIGVAIDGKKVMLRAKCPVFERLAFNLVKSTSL